MLTVTGETRGESKAAESVSEVGKEATHPETPAPETSVLDPVEAAVPAPMQPDPAPAQMSVGTDAPVLRGVRTILPPMVTYAQNFEDVLIRRALADIERGYYVDVGAFHPVVDSVTCWFYSQGWTGINVEPNPRFNVLLREARPHDLNLAVAVSDTSGEIELHLLDGLSTTVAEVADQHANSGRQMGGRVRVPTLSLNDLFARHVGDRTIDFLKIDVEGAEAAILDVCSFDTVRPRLIVVEATEPDSVEQSAIAWEGNLLGKGYLFCYFDGLNRYYVRQEEAWRADLFDAPPNVFDSFRLAFTDKRVDYVASARIALDQAPKGGIDALIAERDRLRAERDQWSTDAQSFLSARDELSVALRTRQIAHETELRTERALFAQELAALAQELAADEEEREKARVAAEAERERAHAAEEMERERAHAAVEAERERAHAAAEAERERVHAAAEAERERGLMAEREAREALIASLHAQVTQHEAAVADLRARLGAVEAHAARLAAARDVSLLASARLQIKLDAMRIPVRN